MSDYIWSNGPNSICPNCKGDAKLVWSGAVVITCTPLFHLYW